MIKGYKITETADKRLTDLEDQVKVLQEKVTYLGHQLDNTPAEEPTEMRSVPELRRDLEEEAKETE